jgi:hypothetical protein
VSRERRGSRGLACWAGGVVLGCTLYDQALLNQANGGGAGRGGDEGARASGGASGSSFAAGSGGEPAGSSGFLAVTGGAAGGSTEAGAPAAGGNAGLGGSSSGSGGAHSDAGESGGGAGGASGAGEAGDGNGGETGCGALLGCECDEHQAACESLVAALEHRYSFDGEGTSIEDTRGALHGALSGTDAALSGSGVLVLAGGGGEVTDPKQHVALPPGCLDDFTEVTLELWFASSAGGEAWQHVFDFGQPSDATTGSALWFSPQAQNTETGTSRAAYGASGYDDDTVVIGPALSAGPHHVAVVVDSLLTLYVDGEFAGSQALSAPLTELVSENCWLGRSNFAGDPYFGGTLDEVRIYRGALAADAVRFSHDAGPNPGFF